MVIIMVVIVLMITDKVRLFFIVFYLEKRMRKEIPKFPELVKQKVTNFSEIFSVNKFRVN